MVFDPWRQETWDVNDTVLVSDPKDDPDVGDFFRPLPEEDYLDTWYEQRGNGGTRARRAGSRRKDGRPREYPDRRVLRHPGPPLPHPAHNRYEKKQAGTTITIDEKYPTRTELDIEGNQRAVIDALLDPITGKGRVVMRYDYDMLGNRIHQASMEAGGAVDVEGCDRASAKDFHEIRAVFTRRVA